MGFGCFELTLASTLEIVRHTFRAVGPDQLSPQRRECLEVRHRGIEPGRLGRGAQPLLGQEQSPRQPHLAGKDSLVRKVPAGRLLFKNPKAAPLAVPRFSAQCEGLASSF